MAKAAANSRSAFDLLLDAAGVDPAPVCVLVGEESFLKHEARRASSRGSPAPRVARPPSS